MIDAKFVNVASEKVLTCAANALSFLVIC